MNPIEEADVSSWAQHLPKWFVNGHSKTVCAYICFNPEHKAHETAERWSKKLRWSYESSVCRRRNFIELKVSATSQERH